jgi:hypothetical protein
MRILDGRSHRCGDGRVGLQDVELGHSHHLGIYPALSFVGASFLLAVSMRSL